MTQQPISDPELDALLTARDPLRDVTLEGPALDTSLSALHSTIAPRRSPARVTRRRLAFAASAALAACAAVLVGLLSFGGGSGGGSGLPLSVSPAQAAELDRIAHRAAQVAGPGPGQWLYERSEVSMGGGSETGSGRIVVNTHSTVTDQEWIGLDGEQRQRAVVRSFRFDTPHDRAVYAANRARLGLADVAGVSDAEMPRSGKTPLAPQSMPDTSAGIVAAFATVSEHRRVSAREALRAAHGGQFEADLFGEIDRLLTNSTSRTQRAAALAAIKYVRGVKVLGSRRDALGRRGTAIEDGFRDQTTTIIVDERNGNVLQETLDLTGAAGGMPAKDGFHRAVYLQRAIVGSETALPNGGQQPFHAGALNVAKPPSGSDAS